MFKNYSFGPTIFCKNGQMSSASEMNCRLNVLQHQVGITKKMLCCKCIFMSVFDNLIERTDTSRMTE